MKEKALYILIIITVILLTAACETESPCNPVVIHDTIYISVDTTELLNRYTDAISGTMERYWEDRQIIAKRKIDSMLNDMYVERDAIVQELDSLRNTIFKDNMIINGTRPAEARFDSSGKPILIMK